MIIMLRRAGRASRVVSSQVRAPWLPSARSRTTPQADFSSVITKNYPRKQTRPFCLLSPSALRCGAQLHTPFPRRFRSEIARPFLLARLLLLSLKDFCSFSHPFL